jgi:hypothetical protein
MEPGEFVRFIRALCRLCQQLQTAVTFAATQEALWTNVPDWAGFRALIKACRSVTLSPSLSLSRCSVARSLVSASFLLAEHVVATGIYLVVFSVVIKLADVIGAEVSLLREINCN